MTGRIKTVNIQAIMLVLEDLMPEGHFTQTEEGIRVEAELIGANARELNRALLSALRRAERRTSLHAEWNAGGITERYFDYVFKGIHQVE
jgi:hypothetical protein